MDENTLLIDFDNSPAQKYNPQPLIPVPPQTTLIDIKESYDDPFEVHEVNIGPLDPFEIALKCACNSSSTEQTHQTHFTFDNICCEMKDDNNFNDQNNEGKKICVSALNTEDKCNNLSSLRHHVLNKEAQNNKDSVRDDIHNYSNNNNNPVNISSSAKLNNEIVSSSVSGDVQEEDNYFKITGDHSITEENIKAVIAKRVNKCIEQVLNRSLKISKQKGSSPLKTCHNRRSFSFVGFSSATDKNDDRLNKSFSDLNGTFTLENIELNTPNISSDSSCFQPLSPHPSEKSQNKNPDDKVFKEALRLSRTFSKLAESFCNCEEPGSESDDDNLLNCKPRWLYTADSSEDEEEKLRKDPKLNFRRRSDSSAFKMPHTKISSAPDSPALTAFKSRRSVTQIQINTTQDEGILKRSNSFGGKPFESSPPETIIPAIVTTVPMSLIKPDDQPIKLKKKTADVKKGPMRAVVPIQNMTKEPFTCEVKQKPVNVNKYKEGSSPDLKTQGTSENQIMGTPSKDNSHLNITPMACSTPNKVENFGFNGKPNPLKPVVQVPANKRHSFESSIGDHKSRSTDLGGGARPRSNSANSSIPRVMSVKPLKSTSNLHRTPNTQVNTKKIDVCEKKVNAQPKASLKSRVLTEVKTRSPRQSKVKAAVSTISNLVMGKARKGATRDKENRVPV